MQILMIVLLVVLCAALALRVYTVEKSLHDCARQLGAWGDGRNGYLLIKSPGGGREELFTAINTLAALRQSEAVDYHKQERAIRRQIANISHDLRTPLTSILGYLQLLGGDTLTPEERKEYLEIVYSRAQNLQSLITSFYDLSRLEEGEYQLEKVPVPLHGVMSRLVAEYYNDFSDKEFRMTVELAEGLPPVIADPAGVLRVLTNLLRNALEHGEKHMEIRLYEEGNTLVTSFSNDAAALTDEDIEHVFDRFFTADKMRTGKSTGLGLAIVKTLTERMGCRASAEYQEGVFTAAVRWKLQ